MQVTSAFAVEPAVEEAEAAFAVAIADTPTPAVATVANPSRTLGYTMEDDPRTLEEVLVVPAVVLEEAHPTAHLDVVATDTASKIAGNTSV